jgi:hypothetical protein
VPFEYAKEVFRSAFYNVLPLLQSELDQSATIDEALTKAFVTYLPAAVPLPTSPPPPAEYLHRKDLTPPEKALIDKCRA